MRTGLFLGFSLAMISSLSKADTNIIPKALCTATKTTEYGKHKHGSHKINDIISPSCRGSVVFINTDTGIITSCGVAKYARFKLQQINQDKYIVVDQGNNVAGICYKQNSLAVILKGKHVSQPVYINTQEIESVLSSNVFFVYNNDVSTLMICISYTASSEFACADLKNGDF